MAPERLRFEVKVESVASLGPTDVPARAEPIFLDPRNFRAYDAFMTHFEEQGSSPTVRELGSALGIRSTSMVNTLLIRLGNAGCLNKIGKGKSRGYVPAISRDFVRQIPISEES